MGGSTRCFSIGDKGGPFVRGSVATVEQAGPSEVRSELMRVRGHRPRHQSRSKVTGGWSVENRTEFWFYKPVGDSADGWGTENKKNAAHKHVPRHLVEDSTPSLCFQSFLTLPYTS